MVIAVQQNPFSARHHPVDTPAQAHLEILKTTQIAVLAVLRAGSTQDAQAVLGQKHAETLDL